MADSAVLPLTWSVAPAERKSRARSGSGAEWGDKPWPSCRGIVFLAEAGLGDMRLLPKTSSRGTSNYELD